MKLFMEEWIRTTVRERFISSETAVAISLFLLTLLHADLTSEDGFIHRNGRTARWDAEGSAYIIMYSEEKVPDYLPAEIDVFTLPEITPKPSKPEFVTLYIGKGKKDKINKIDIVGFLFKKGGLNKDDVGKVDVKDHYAFVAISRKKSQQTLKLIQNEKIKGIKTLIELAK